MGTLSIAPSHQARRLRLRLWPLRGASHQLFKAQGLDVSEAPTSLLMQGEVTGQLGRSSSLTSTGWIWLMLKRTAC